MDGRTHKGDVSMGIKVAYIPHGPGVQESPDWGEIIMLKNLIANSGPGFKIIPTYGVRGDVDLIFHHNLANTAMFRRRWVRGGSWLERRVGHPIPALYNSHQSQVDSLDIRPKIMGGIRGYNGLLKSRHILKYFDAVHVNNIDLQKKVLSYGARKAYVLYPGVDLDLFKPDLDLRPDTFTIGWSGDTTKPVKNAHLIHRVGYNYKTASKENYIPHAEMPKFYNSLDVYVSFSSSEGWGRGIIEAMACGLPVVCSEAGASEILSPEWVIPGDPRGRGFIAKMRTRLKLLERFKSLREDVGADNRERVKPWGWPVISKCFENVCREVVNSEP